MKLEEMIDIRSALVIPSYGEVRKFVLAKMRELHPVDRDDLITKAQETLVLPRFDNVPLKLKQSIISDVISDWGY